MGFDAKAFRRAEAKPRTADVIFEHSDLVKFFPDGETPAWKVRGLSGRDMAQITQVAETYNRTADWLEGLLSDASQERREAIRKLTGAMDESPPDFVKRVEYVIRGSVDPEVDTELAIKLAREFPVEFYAISNKIIELTGLGHVVGKFKPSGETQQSGAV